MCWKCFFISESKDMDEPKLKAKRKGANSLCCPNCGKTTFIRIKEKDS